MTSKIRIKMGPIEVEYEGSENFLKEELPQLLGAVSNLYKESDLSSKTSYEAPTAIGEEGIQIPKMYQIEGTTGSIALSWNARRAQALLWLQRLA